MENRDPQKDGKEETLLDLAKRRKKITKKGVSFKLSILSVKEIGLILDSQCSHQLLKI